MRKNSVSASLIVLAVLSGASDGVIADANVFCASGAQAADINAFFADNNALPAIAAQRLKLPELMVASALSADRAIGTDGAVFYDIWDALTRLEHAMVLVLKAGHVFEIHGPIPPGTPSTRSQYFNVEFEFDEGAEEEGFSGHLRPDLLTAIYAFKLPGEGGVSVRSVFFYSESGNSDFGVVVGIGDAAENTATRIVFDEIWSTIEGAERICN